MTLLGHIVPLDTLPEQVVCRGWLWNLQAVDLDIREGVDFLFNRADIGKMTDENMEGKKPTSV